MKIDSSKQFLYQSFGLTEKQAYDIKKFISDLLKEGNPLGEDVHEVLAAWDGDEKELIFAMFHLGFVREVNE